ncbi:hypothetical protein [Conexibacter woesei]|uniref:hypothetical protein n=1 Tax=Conexibacter woesei TaxID=191495 RepID=UPI000411E8DE|nr:hypothetical protein [Conexibacter woesei]
MPAIAALALAAAVALAAAPSAHATDSWPCGSQTTKPWSTQPVQLCPLTPAGALAPNGWVPVYTNPVAVPDDQQPPAPAGWLHSTDGEYFVCDRYVADADYNHPTQTWHHHWWAYTLADSPAVWGWVNETYFKGGNDDEADAGLRRCPSATGAPAPTAAAPQPPVVTAPSTSPTSATPPASVAAPTTDPVLPSPTAPSVNPTGCEPLPASASVVLHANVGKARRTRIVDAGDRIAVRGTLIGADGAPLANADLCVASRPDLPDGSTRVVGPTHTNAQGQFTYILAPSTSQQVSVVHRDGDTAASDTVNLQVRIPMRIHPSRRLLHNGDVLTLRGLLDRIAHPGGIVVVFEARRGTHWQTFGSATTRADGTYTLKYRFTATIGVQRYRLRARIPVQAGFPFASSHSHAVTVGVRG